MAERTRETDIINRGADSGRDSTSEQSFHLSTAAIQAVFERLKNGTRFHIAEGHEHPVDTSDPLLFERVTQIVQSRVRRLERLGDPRLALRRDEVLRTVLQTMATEPHGMVVTPELYYRAKLIAEQPDEDVTEDEVVFPYIMKILVHTIDQRVRDHYAQSAEAASFDFQDQLVADAVDIAILEQRMLRHEFSGLNKSYEAMRDRFVIERDRLRREIQATGKPLVLLSIEMDVKGLKNLNDALGPHIVDSHIFGPLGRALQKGLRDTDFATQPSLISQPAGDEFLIMMNLVEPGSIEAVPQRLHSEIIANADYSEEVKEHGVGFRIGVRSFTLEEVNALPTDDVVEFITAFRNDALQAAAECKRKKRDTIIWTPELAQGVTEQTAEHLTERLQRDLSGFLADVRRLYGDERARLAEARLVAVWQEIQSTQASQPSAHASTPDQA